MTITIIIIIIWMIIHTVLLVTMIQLQVDYLVRARQLALTGHYPHLTDLHQVLMMMTMMVMMMVMMMMIMLVR